MTSKRRYTNIVKARAHALRKKVSNLQLELMREHKERKLQTMRCIACVLLATRRRLGFPPLPPVGAPEERVAVYVG